jgi:hypothetical protein
MKTSFWALLIIALILLAPFATIWSLLVLKAVLVQGADPYTIETWCAAIVLGSLFKTTIKKD